VTLKDGKAVNAKLGMEFFVDYSHLLPGHPKCGVIHGHSDMIIVEVSGNIRSNSSSPSAARKDVTAWMIMDFSEMKDRVWKVLERVDHKDLNELFDVPTSENIVSWIYSQLKKSRLNVSKVTFFEGNGKWCSVEA
jgi:6-pyruvoyltetrahydropterin/6-carboxytetrahydropterin synthase